jgi:hypothetical protein
MWGRMESCAAVANRRRLPCGQHVPSNHQCNHLPLFQKGFAFLGMPMRPTNWSHSKIQMRRTVYHKNAVMMFKHSFNRFHHIESEQSPRRCEERLKPHRAEILAEALPALFIRNHRGTAWPCREGQSQKQRHKFDSREEDPWQPPHEPEEATIKVRLWQLSIGPNVLQ